MNGKFFTLVENIAELFYLNVLWLLCSLPILTVGASTTALLYVLMKKKRGEEGYMTKDYFKAFRQNFLQSSIIWLILLLILSVTGTAFYISNRNAEGTSTAILILLGIIASVFLLILIYVFALQARYENTIAGTIKNSLLLAIGNLPDTIFMVALIASIVILIVFVPYLIIVLLLFGGAGIANLLVPRYIKVFDRMTGEVTENKEKGEQDDGEEKE